MNKNVFIIAEAGVNHNGDIGIAKQLVDKAKAAKVDAIKFQSFNADKLVTKNAPKAEYQKKNTGNGNQYNMLKKLELSLEDHIELKKYCDEKSIMFLSTPFDEESVDLLEQIGVSLYKVSSGDLTNIPLLQYIASKNKPIILSTGMANLGEIEYAIYAIKEVSNIEIKLLHCTSNYPTKYEDVNLKAMHTLKNAFNLEVGYSDHTNGIEIPIAAVAMGAQIIEKHFTIDKNMEGPDHKASLNPFELKEMVSSIRHIEQAFGNGIKKCNKNEKNTRKIARKSIVLCKPIKKDQVIERSCLTCKRPGTGISPKYINKLIGKIANIDMEKEYLISWEDVR